jgi:Dolichyl-phosphate-mannose-protein mannosyltransferase
MRLRFFFILLALWTCALVNPGNLGTVDTTRRLQVARWIWLNQPPVRADDPAAGPVGRNGVRYLPTGIGQSLVLVPFDALASGTIGPFLRRLSLDTARRGQVIELAVAFLMQSFLTACLLILAYEVLRSFTFPAAVSAAGAIALLFGTTVLAYVQAAQENLLLLTLALLMLFAIRRFLVEPSARWALLAGLASGFALLTRMTSSFETVVWGLYGFANTTDRKRFAAGFVPPIFAALIFDRWYQYYRFGSVFSTYIGVTQSQLRPRGAPENYYFSYPFWKGFLGALFSKDKSVLLFDPFLVLLIVVAIWKWREISRELRTILALLALLALIYISAAAKYVAFGGDVAWGDRYVLLPIQLLCLFTVPLLLTRSGTLPLPARYALWSVVAAAFVLQAASTVIAPNLEVEQRNLGFDRGVLVNRAINLEEIARDREQTARFAGVPEEWRTLYYFPFQLRFRFPMLAWWTIAAWLALLVTLPLVILGTLRAARGGGRP